jgi:hypothetical protein
MLYIYFAFSIFDGHANETYTFHGFDSQYKVSIKEIRNLLVSVEVLAASFL